MNCPHQRRWPITEDPRQPPNCSVITITPPLAPCQPRRHPLLWRICFGTTSEHGTARHARWSTALTASRQNSYDQAHSRERTKGWFTWRICAIGCHDSMYLLGNIRRYYPEHCLMLQSLVSVNIRAVVVAITTTGEER